MPKSIPLLSSRRMLRSIWLSLFLVVVQFVAPVVRLVPNGEHLRWEANATAVMAAPSAGELSNRYVIFLDGINSSSPPDDGAGGFQPIRDKLSAEGINRFVYFSYSATHHKAEMPVGYCRGWGDDNCSSDGQNSQRLVDLYRRPVYSGDDTHLSVTDQADVLDWLIGQIVSRDATAEISLIGFSLGGVVASYWGATHGPGTPYHGHIHSIILINSPVGGIPLANVFRDGCDPSSWASVIAHAVQIRDAAAGGLKTYLPPYYLTLSIPLNTKKKDVWPGT